MSATVLVVGCGLFSPRVCLSDYAMLPFRVEFYQEEPMALARQAKEIIPSLYFTGDEIPKRPARSFSRSMLHLLQIMQKKFSAQILKEFLNLFITHGV